VGEVLCMSGFLKHKDDRNRQLPQQLLKKLPMQLQQLSSEQLVLKLLTSSYESCKYMWYAS